MALNSLICADVPLRNCSLTHFKAEFKTEKQSTATEESLLCRLCTSSLL